MSKEEQAQQSQKTAENGLIMVPRQNLDGLIYGWFPNTRMIMPGGDDIRTMPGDNGIVYFWRVTTTVRKGI